MQPFARISSGGLDLTGGLSDRLLSIEVYDEAEDKSDRVTITLDDRRRWSDAAVLSIPQVGKVVSVTMGYRGGAAANLGSFLIDEIKVTSPMATLQITGRAADMSKSYRAPRTQSYHQMTLGAIMGEIAERNGYDLAIDPALSGIMVRHADQNGESDMAFAVRIAGTMDAVARPVDGKLAVARRGTGMSVSGQPLPVIGVSETDCQNWDFHYSARDEAGEAGGLDGEGSAQQAAGDAGGAETLGGESLGLPTGGAQSSLAGGVRAYWTDLRTGERMAVTVGQEPYHDLRYTHHNEAEAIAAVAAYRNQSARGKSSFSCTIGGNPRVQAEALLVLAGFRPYMPRAWRVKTAVHRYQSGGYTTDISAELFVPEQESVPDKVAGTTPTEDDTIDPGAPPEPVEVGGEEYIIRLPGEEAP